MSPLAIVSIAAESLAAQRSRTWLTAIAVVIGTAAVLLLLAIGEGGRGYIREQFGSFGSNLLRVSPGKVETVGFVPPFAGTVEDLTMDDVDALRRRCPSAKEVVPSASGSALVKAGERSRRVLVIGATREAGPTWRMETVMGDFLPGSEGGRAALVCVLGNKLREELFPAESPLGKRVRVGETTFLVIGVLAAMGDFLGFDLDDAVYVPVERAMRLLNLKGMTSIDLEAKSAELVEQVEREARACLVARHGREDFTIVAQDKALAVLDELVASLGYALAGIAAVSLLVAGVGIMNMQLVAVLDRTAEIGLRIAVGARRRDIMLQFFLEATLLAGAGAVAGWAVSRVVVLAAGALFPEFPMVIPQWAAALTIASAAAVGAAFGFFPARRAARRSPLEALRHE